MLTREEPMTPAQRLPIIYIRGFVGDTAGIVRRDTACPVRFRGLSCGDELRDAG